MKEIKRLRLILKTPRLYQQYLKDIGQAIPSFITQVPSNQQLPENKIIKKKPTQKPKVTMEALKKRHF